MLNVANAADLVRKCWGVISKDHTSRRRIKGAHPPELFRELEIAELDQLIAVSQHTLRVVALAPEKEGALQAIRHLKQQNVRVMLGHSAATWQQTPCRV
ncbi:N-acetylglucosamine-6-phosphate deacetylase (GlcNAc 6-P deacetylase) [Escherichia coli]|uniref:N-acetylglucosamine-6-phosphate deacetylase (GlcNAc 6-P deacetylase) n=1 Tax=Escherichia coli TaxID=562 RepID=A0A376VBR0_ECOLX|nr:N-acetylglucosamine-6-phosphate deacetylase (GlcNAc 6-P deacetylase) [Escherichia coli]